MDRYATAVIVATVILDSDVKYLSVSSDDVSTVYYTADVVKPNGDQTLDRLLDMYARSLSSTNFKALSGPMGQ